MKIEQEIMEMFDKEFCSLYGNKVYVYDNNKGKHILSNLENDADKIKSFISHIITLVQKREREEMVEFLKNNTEVGESYERGEVYLKIGEAETTGSGNFDWDNDFWREVLNELK